MLSFSKADAKVRTIFETTKLFRSFFQKVFLKWVSSLIFVFTISSLPRISLDCGCKGRAFPHTHQTPATLFSHFFAKTIVSHWYSNMPYSIISQHLFRQIKAPHLSIYTRARIYGESLRNPSPYSPHPAFILPQNKGHRLFEKDDGP